MLSVPVMILGVPAAHLLFQVLGTDARVSEAGTGYLQIVVLGMPFSFLYLTAGAVMRACGNTVLPMKITCASVALNVVLAPVFIYGLGPVPALGVPGSAIATVISMACAVVAYGCLIARRHPDLPIRTASLRRLDSAMLGSLALVGVPYCLIGILFSVVYLFYAAIAARFGDAALAILGIGNRLESITYLTAEGFAVATSTFVGQNLGAKNPARAEQGAWRAMRIMSAIGAGIGVLFLIAPQLLLRLFTGDATAIALGIPYLRILSICQIFTGLEGAVGGGFVGAGNTVPPMLIHVVFAVLRFPLGAWVSLRLGYGIYGIAWTMSLTCILRGVLLAAWFRRGRWKQMALPGSLRPLPSPEEPETTIVV
jgi:putative MATE family efflux protein